MKYFKLALIIYILLPMSLFLNSNQVSAEVGELEKDSDGVYQIEIRAMQWKFTAVDKVKYSRLMDEGLGKAKALEEASFEHRIGSFEKGSNVVVSLVSRDVMHGFSINEVELSLSANRREGEQEYSDPVVQEITVPNADTIITGFCQIFCGLGHPDMKIKFVIGEGLPNYGLYAFIAFMSANVLLFGYSFTKIGKKQDTVTAA
ncbi:MAG: hypothetical protein OEZ01_01090 [Candidatus Heimdallarchaeota archaeon]|nr:hypothetical protein [Candidatus Heimdallarchaeota archaeon]MDH5644568.1 hypothetical protein [Candidatus Heimdallarchaeota archaeon]